MNIIGKIQNTYHVWAMFSSSSSSLTPCVAGYHARITNIQHRILNSTADLISNHGVVFCGNVIESTARVMLAMQANTPHTASNTLTDFHMDVLSEQQYAAERAKHYRYCKHKRFQIVSVTNKTAQCTKGTQVIKSSQETA